MPFYGQNTCCCNKRPMSSLQRWLMEKILLWATMLVTFGVWTLFAQDDDVTEMRPITLDMAQNSVDDRYDGCKKEMREIARNYLNMERIGNFENAWTRVDRFYSDRRLGGSRRGRNGERSQGGLQRGSNSPLCNLQKQHVTAMHVYTLENPSIYRDFNKAVRTQGPAYTSYDFGYHVLHFYLTDAIQTLNSQTPESERCVTTYRRVDLPLRKNNSLWRRTLLMKKFRFGAFTSSSLGGYPSPGFGEKTCFNITSCFGADISHCSQFSNEREVLIPPYEVFKVTKIEKRSNNKELPCEVVYTVESTKSAVSNLNCALVPGHKKGGKCSKMKGKMC